MLVGSGSPDPDAVTLMPASAQSADTARARFARLVPSALGQSCVRRERFVRLALHVQAALGRWLRCYAPAAKTVAA